MPHAQNKHAETLQNIEYANSDSALDRVIDLTTEPLFLENGYDKGVDVSNLDSEDFARHLNEYAEDYCRISKLDGTEDSASLSELALFANAPLLVLQQQKLNANQKKHDLPSIEFHQAKDDLVHSNSLITDYINEHPTENIHSLINNLSATVDRFKDTPDQNARTIIEEHIKGIRTEGGFVQLASQLKGVEIRPATPQQERKGVDFAARITLPSRNQPVGVDIDIKRSLDQVAGQAGGYSDDQDTFAMKEKGHFKFCPLIPDSAYENDSFLLKPEFLDLMLPRIGMQLYKMAMMS